MWVRYDSIESVHIIILIKNMTYNCSNCNKEDSVKALRLCSLCKSVMYCNKECQKAHWISHKSTCTQQCTLQLISAIEANNFETVSELSKMKRVLNGNVNYTPPVKELKRWSALHECVRNHNLNMMKVLIDNGANVDIVDKDGESPLFLASRNESMIEVVKLLLDAGADPNKKAKDGWTCLMMSARNGDYETTKALLDAKADNYLGRDMFGRTAFDLAHNFAHGIASQTRGKETVEESRARFKSVADLISDYERFR